MISWHDEGHRRVAKSGTVEIGAIFPPDGGAKSRSPWLWHLRFYHLPNGRIGHEKTDLLAQAALERAWLDHLADAGLMTRQQAGDDTARLDFLDQLNANLNARCGTNYRWEMVINHNVNRLMTGRHLDVDLNDARAHGFNSCRDAIDREMLRIAAIRSARAAAGGKS